MYTIFGPWTLQTFTLVVGLAIVLSAGIGIQRARQGKLVSPSGSPVVLVTDSYLGALVGGVVVGRIFHVLLSWDYFRFNVQEAFNVSAGGLDWHGAVLGGLFGLYLITRWRKASFRDLLDPLTPALPLVGMAAWWGCLASACGYGQEVDNLSRYPAYAVTEAPDIFGIVAPRYNTQLYGVALSLLVLGLALLLLRLGWLRGSRFWVILLALSLGMFTIGFWRGDYSLYAFGLRADQVLDALLAAIAVGSLVSPLTFQRATVRRQQTSS
jgi:phosphatidylglycerol:prolipoprotein diacylglycerol transferase